MEPVRMMHPQHGWTHAYDPDEVKKLEGWGWSVEEPVKTPEAVAVEAPVVKRGRPKKVA